MASDIISEVKQRSGEVITEMGNRLCLGIEFYRVSRYLVLQPDLRSRINIQLSCRKAPMCLLRRVEEYYYFFGGRNNWSLGGISSYNRRDEVC